MGTKTRRDWYVLAEEWANSLWDQNLVVLLTNGQVTAQQLHPLASNYTFLVRLQGQNGTESLAIYKPEKGETPLWDFPDGTLYKREYATYVIAQALGWDFVPPTVIRDGPYGKGSMQLYVEHDYQEHYFTLREKFSTDFKRICLFDWIANNADRKAGACLLGVGGHIWGIDHGLTFHEMPKLRTVIWEFADQLIPTPLLEDLEKLRDRLVSADNLLSTLTELLSFGETEALVGRLNLILEQATFPAPPTNRRGWPWPWY